MSSIKKVQVGIADPWAGAVHLLGADRFLKHKRIEAYFQHGIVAEISFYLNYLGQRRDPNDENEFNDLQKSAYPDYYQRLPQLLGKGKALSALSSGDAPLFLESVLELAQIENEIGQKLQD